MTRRIRLRPMDAAFLLAETRSTPMHVAGLQIFRVPEGASPHFVSELYDYMRGFPVVTEPFNYRLDRRLSGKLLPQWEIRDDVDLDYHLRYSALPHPGGERELGILVSRLHSIHMDLTRPLWEMHLIEGLQGNRFAIYIKLHHALVDGTAAMRLMTISNDPENGFAPPVWSADLGREFSHRASDAGLIERASEVLQSELAGLPSLTRGVARSARALLGLPDSGELTSIGEAPRTILNVKISGQRRVATHRVELARIKSIARAAGGTVNDIVLTACGGALRRYLSGLGKLPDASLIASVPVALMREEREAAGNAVSNFLARLGTDIADPRRRFEVVKRSSEAGKSHLREMTETAIANYTMIVAVPVLITGRFPDLGTLARPLFNVIISNVPGPRARLRFHGAEMEAFYPVSQIGHGLALNITVIGYADQLTFGLVACRDRLPSMQRLAVALGEAVEELEAAFPTPTPGKPVPTGRRKKTRASRSGAGPRSGQATRGRSRAKSRSAPS
jgi:diacylglycerol O-acyltransferase